MKFTPLFLILFTAGVLNAQNIPFIKADQITRWKTADNDTLYVLNFWATWCGPCVEELPSFEKLNRKYAGQKVKVILISTDFKRNVEKGVKSFVQRKKLKSEVVFMDESNPNNYVNLVDTTWSGAIPATLIVSRRKNVAAFFEKQLTYKELRAVIKKAL